MIRHILWKDWKLLWPMVLFLTFIQICLQWVQFRFGYFADDPTAGELLRPLTMAWFAGVAAITAAVVQLDAIPGLDQDWLIRPLRRTDLLLAKLSFLLLTVSLPMLIVDTARVLSTG